MTYCKHLSHLHAGARGREQRRIRGVWSGPFPLGAGANDFCSAVLPSSEAESKFGRCEQAAAVGTALCREQPQVPGAQIRLQGCQKSDVWLNSLLFNRLQQEWSIVTATAPEPTSLTIQGATTAMMTCHGLGPEKEGKLY